MRLFKKKDTTTVEVPNWLMEKFVYSVNEAGLINTATMESGDAMRVVDLYHNARTLIETWKEQK